MCRREYTMHCVGVAAADSYADGMRIVTRFKDLDGPNVNPDCHTRIYSHGHRTERSLPGQVQFVNNLSDKLNTAAGDALYAETLYIMLALPGALVGIGLAYLAALGTVERDRRELALLGGHPMPVGRRPALRRRGRASMKRGAGPDDAIARLARWPAVAGLWDLADYPARHVSRL